MAISLSSTLPSSNHFLPHQKNPKKGFNYSCRATIETNNLYKVLSLSPKEATQEKIKKAYRNMALRYHPDVCPSMNKEECTKMFLQVQKAYKTLSDPVLREEYDNGLLLVGLMTRGFRANSFDGSLMATRNRWRDQLHDLKIRSTHRMSQKERSSWATRMRLKTQKHNNI